MQLTSSAFEPNQAIPQKFSCDGQNISPALSWDGQPAETESYVLICDDPDAPGGTFVHWLYYNIPAEVKSLPAAVDSVPQPAPGGLQGKNSFGKTGYGGPCPPGGTHRYFFTLYALDFKLDAQAGLDKRKLMEAIDGHVIAEAQLMGTYSR
ncbi:MAG: YbhB/YbcL family Raf kinase inhibitor-like protein [Spirochaetota bacterium]